MSNSSSVSDGVGGNGAQAGSYRVAGRVQFDNFVEHREKGEAAIETSAGDVVIDLSGLEHSNTLAVALLTAWYRAAEQRGKSIRFVGVPGDLLDIIELSGLTEVLPVQGAAAEQPATLEEGR